MTTILEEAVEEVVLCSLMSKDDPAGTRLVGDALRRLGQPRSSLLIAEHKTDLLDGLCSRIIVIDNGAIVSDGPADDVLEDPRLVELGVEPPSRVRLARAVEAGGGDPRRISAVLG